MSHLVLLTEIARLVGEADTLQGVLDRVVRLVAERMKTDVCSIWLLNGERTLLRLAATQGLNRSAVGRVALERGLGLGWLVLEQLAPVMVQDAPSHPRYNYLPETHEEKFRSFLGIPLLVRRTPIGVLVVRTRDRRRFVPDDVRAMSAIASQIAPVVDNARLLSLIAGNEATPEPTILEVGPRRVLGTPCCAGVVSGALARIGAPARPAVRPTGSVPEELARLREACAGARRELLQMQEWLRQRNAEEAALVFSAQILFLDDPSFEGRMRAAVEQGASAASAVEQVSDDVLARFSGMKDYFFRERADDVEDLRARLLRLVHEQHEAGQERLKGKIAVVAALKPSQLVTLWAEGVAGVLAGAGGATSHSALLARSLDLPLVVGLSDFLDELRTGRKALVDASSGEVVLDPPDELVAEVARAAAASEASFGKLAAGDGDGEFAPKLDANVSLWGDAVRAREVDADGIGLYRSEFAFLLRPDLPSEEEQYVTYRRIVETMAPKPVTLRLLDAGGDKLVPALGVIPEPNPFLGYRSLRLLLEHTEILDAQINAMTHALQGTSGRILVPMVGSIEEFRAIRAHVERAGDSMPPVGAMIEVPSALLEIDELAAEADFLCVGTNDLTQHLLGVDRTNARVNKYFDPCHPAVVRALHRIADAAHDASKSLCVCGEAASNPIFLPVWIGLAVDRLSAHTARIPLLRALRRRIDPDAAREVLGEILALDTTEAIRTRLRASMPDEVRPYLPLAAGTAST